MIAIDRFSEGRHGRIKEQGVISPGLRGSRAENERGRRGVQDQGGASRMGRFQAPRESLTESRCSEPGMNFPSLLSLEA
jgi:hypothetical protein